MRSAIYLEIVAAALLLIPLAAYAGQTPVVARIGAVQIHADEIACRSVCPESAQERLTRKVVALVAEEALALAGIDSDAELRQEIRRRLPPEETLRAMSSMHRKIATAAVQALRDGNIDRAYEEHLQPNGIPLSMLERFLQLAGSVERASEFLERDLDRKIREDIEKQIADEWRVRRLRGYLEELCRADTERADQFWSAVLQRSEVEILSPQLRRSRCERSAGQS